MAILEKPTLGLVSGKTGDVVYRIVDGKVIITTYPDHIKISTSEECVANRKNFGVLSHIVKVINKIPLLKSIWKKVPGKNISTKFIKVNKQIYCISKDIKDLIITPAEEYFPITLNDVKINGSNISMTFDAVSNSSYNYMSAQGFIQLLPNDEDESSHYISICSKDEECITGKPLTFNFLMNTVDTSLFNSHQNRKILVNVISKNNFLEPISVSQSVYIEM